MASTTPFHFFAVIRLPPGKRPTSPPIDWVSSHEQPPKIVIAVGACAIAGGPYIGHPEVHNGAASVVPVDLYVPGCPPHPWTILDGLLRLLGKLDRSKR